MSNDAQRRNMPEAAYGRTSRLSGPNAPFSSVGQFPQGIDGSQSGEPSPRVSFVPGMGSSANAVPFEAATPGTQGGGVDESPTMGGERFLQYLIGLGLVAPGAIGGGTVAGTPGAIAGGTIVPMALMGNSEEPNIRDVWTDKLRMIKQGR